MRAKAASNTCCQPIQTPFANPIRNHISLTLIASAFTDTAAQQWRTWHDLKTGE